ncbi:MAG: hypothetical protein IKS36_02695 [Bacteroidales bacterium]|nr:hypothetical protein [Bacteroidales bacterium]
MAESILRLTVNSAEYDNKLKQATQGLTRYADECRKVGGTLEVVEKETLDYVRALGQMETTSRTATGKLAEMKKAFVELSAQYKSMTDEEKNSPFGKALASSLDQLKGRITDSKKSLDDINQSINGGGGLSGALDNLTSKFGISIQSLAGWGAALSAGKVALDVAKDAFFASEATVDEWGRVMDSSKSLYEGFLTALNTGDISGYLSRIDSIVQAARIAYNELDRLGTMKTIQGPQMSAQQTENERMRMMIQTGRYIAPVDGRKASMQNGQLLTPDQIKSIEKQLQGGMQKVVTLIGNEVTQTSRAIDAVYNRQAQELGMSLKEFRKGTSSMAEFDKRMAGYENYQKWRTEHTTIDMQSGREIVARGNPFERYAKWGTFRVDGERYNNLVGLIQQRDQQAGQAYGMQSQVYRTMNRAQGITLRQIMGGGGGGRSGGRSGGGMSIADMLLSTFNKANGKIDASSLMDTTTTGGSELFQMLQAQHQQELKNIPRDSRADFEAGQQRAKNEIEKGNESALSYAKKQLAVADTMAGNLGNILSGLTKMGIELPEGLSAIVEGTQSIISIVTSIMTLVSIISTLTAVKSTPIFGWLLAGGGVAGGSRGRGVIHAAMGTVVPGNTYSGDQIPAMLNAGEVVLNRSQVSTLASSLQGTGMQNMNLQAIVTGEQLRFILNTNSRRRGKGEYVTSTHQ